MIENPIYKKSETKPQSAYAVEEEKHSNNISHNMSSVHHSCSTDGHEYIDIDKLPKHESTSEEKITEAKNPLYTTIFKN